MIEPLRDVELARRTTIGVGGAASRLYELASETELLALLSELDEPFHVLGGGSNVLIADGRIREPVLTILTRGTRRGPPRDPEIEPEIEVFAAAGEPWDPFVASCVDHGLAGLECLSGIPGLVGATPIQNVGAYGQQVSDRIVAVRVLDLVERRIRDLPASACGFAYRDSLFKRDRQRYLLLGVGFRLRQGAPDAVRHGPLRAALEQRFRPAAGAGPAAEPRPSLRRVREAVIELRRARSMIVDPGDPESRSAGSFFLNPVVPRAVADEVERHARDHGLLAANELMPRHEAGPDTVKLAAAWLIERAGYQRGHASGPVGLCRNHALALVNRGGASAAQVIALAREIHDAVGDRFGIDLVPEPDLIGYDEPPPPFLRVKQPLRAGPGR